jgi:putative tricarboxylic transport membrane protein
LDVALVNWRGIVTSPETRPADRKALTEAVALMVKSPLWQEALKKRGWQDFYQTSDEFAVFLTDQQAQISTALKEVGILK